MESVRGILIGSRYGDIFAPDVFGEPLPVMPNSGQTFLWFGDAVAETFVHDQAGRDSAEIR